MKDCNKQYALKNILLAHLRTHYNIKPFMCSFCNKSFNEKGNLKTHIRIHTGERPFKCKQCQKGFKALGQLKDHLISHTGFKPFQCPYCKKYYRRKEILKNHFVIHAKDPFFENNESKFQEMLNDIKEMKNIINNVEESDSICKSTKKEKNFSISKVDTKRKIFKKAKFNLIEKKSVSPQINVENFENINKFNLFEKIKLNNNDFIMNTQLFNDENDNQSIDFTNSLNNLLSSTADSSLKEDNNKIDKDLINLQNKEFSLPKMQYLNEKENDFPLKNEINIFKFLDDKNNDENNDDCCSKMTNLYCQEFEEKRNIYEILG